MAVSRKIADLFYEIRGSTTGFEADLKSAEKSAEKLGAYIKAHPVAAAGALGAALVGVAVQASHMAEEVEKGLKRVELAVPGATGRMGELRAEIRAMSLEGPHSQAQLAATAAEIGRQGVGSLEELQERLHAITRAADATGAEIGAIAGGVDQVFDLFGSRIGSADQVLQQLWATARGRAPLDEVFAAIQGAAPAVRDFGIDFNTATRALGALLDRGLTAKKAASELADLAKQGARGEDVMKQLAAAYDVTANSAQEYEEAIKKANEAGAESWSQLKNNFNAVLIDLGQRILPIVTAELRGLLSILSLFNGELDRMLAKPDLQQLASIGTLPDRIRANAAVSNSPLRREMYEVANRVRERAVEGTLDLGGLSVTQLQNMKKAIDAFTAGVQSSVAAYDPLVDQITEAIAATGKLQEAEAERAANAKTDILTADQVARAEKARVATMLAAADEHEKKLRRMADVMGDISKAIGTSISDWQQEGTKAAAKLGDLQLEAQQYIATLLGDELKSAQLELDRRLAELRGAAAEADRRAGGAQSPEGDRLRGLAEDVQRAFNKAEQLRGEAERFDAALVKAGGSLKDVGNASKEINTTTSDTLEKAREHARLLSEAARGALDLLDAFGLIDERTASILRNVVQVVANVGPLREALNAPKPSAVDVIGAALPVVGGIAQLVSGMMGSTQDMTEAVAQLRLSLADMIDRLRDERLASTRSEAEREAASAASDFRSDVRRISDEAAASGITRLGVIGLSPEDLRRRIDELRTQRAGSPVHGVADALEEVLKNYEQALQDLAERQRLAREALDDELHIRRLRAEGRDDEAALEELRSQQAAEVAAAEATGYYSPEQIDELRRTQAEERRAAEQRIADRRAEEEERRRSTIEDLTARQLTAEGRNREAEDARRAAAQRRELVEATDPVIRAMIELAIAAEEAAIAAERAAAAQRALEDLQVRMLRAQGDDAGADSLAFDLAQRREIEEAIKNEMSQEYIDLLKQVQAAERERRSSAAAAGVGAAVDSATAGSTGRTGYSQSSIQNITLTQADRIVGLLGSIAQNTRELAIIRAALAGTRSPQLTPPALPASFTVGAGGRVIQIRNVITLNFYGPVSGGRETGQVIGDEALRRFNAGMGSGTTLSAIAAGDVSR